LKETVGVGQNDDEDDLPAEDLPGSTAPVGPGRVTIELDRILQPGAAVSGNVTFSDGVSGKWALDQYGRLMLDTGQPGYKPSAPDVQAFQRELQAQLQRHGFLAGSIGRGACPQAPGPLRATAPTQRIDCVGGGTISPAPKPPRRG